MNLHNPVLIILWHFLDSLLVAKIRVRIGEWDFSSTSEPLQNIERKITKKIVHPKYNFFTYENDLALLKLDKRIDFQDNIIPICLPANDDLLIGKNLFWLHLKIIAYLLTFLRIAYCNSCNNAQIWSFQVKWEQLQDGED